MQARFQKKLEEAAYSKGAAILSRFSIAPILKFQREEAIGRSEIDLSVYKPRGSILPAFLMELSINIGGEEEPHIDFQVSKREMREIKKEIEIAERELEALEKLATDKSQQI